MLASMTARQYQEWLAFFKIRQEREKGPEDKPGAAPPTAQQQMCRNIIQHMRQYQAAEDAKKRK